MTPVHIRNLFLTDRLNGDNMKHQAVKSIAQKVRRMFCKRSGFTLIELIVAMAIATIVMTAIVGIFLITYRSYDESSMRTDAQNIAVLVLQKINGSVRYRDTVTIYSDKSAVPATELPIYFDSSTNGIKFGDDTYLDGSLKRYNCIFEFSNDNYSADYQDKTKNNLLKIKVTITDKTGKALFKTTGSVYLLNGEISNNDTGAAITYS